MTTPDEPVPHPNPEPGKMWFTGFSVFVILVYGAKWLEPNRHPAASAFRSLPKPAAVAPPAPAQPRVSPEQNANWNYWQVLGAIMRCDPKSGTTLISIATDFQIKADQIRRLDPEQVDPATLRCGDAVAAYYSTIARVYRYSFSGAHSMQVLSQVVSGKDNGVVGTSIEMMAEMTHRRAEAISAASAAHFALQQRFGQAPPALPAIQ